MRTPRLPYDPVMRGLMTGAAVAMTVFGVVLLAAGVRDTWRRVRWGRRLRRELERH